MAIQRDLRPDIIRQRLTYEALTDKLVGPEQIKTFLTELADVTKMEVLQLPITSYAHEMGWAGWIHWKTSGAGVYSYPGGEHNGVSLPPLVTVETYTCKPFHIGEAVDFSNRYFKALDHEIDSQGWNDE